ncbi:MAG: tetratricopeptide repeat protein, partial [Chitinivibrionales bacterium]
MYSERSSSAVDDYEKEGRTLTEGEYVKALINRNDIFLIENKTSFYAIELLVLTVGLFLGFWLTAMPIKTLTSAPDFYQIKSTDRTVRLIHAQERKLAAGPAETRAKVVRFSIKNNTNKAFPRINVRIRRATTFEQRELHEALNTGPGDTDLISQGIAYSKKENYGKAIDYFRRALGKDSHNERALSGLGDAYLYAGLLDSSAANYKAAIAVNPRIAAVHIGLGSVFYFNATSPSFIRATRAYNTSEAFIKSQYDSAMAEYDRAISLDSIRVEAFVNRGLVREILSDTEGAIKDYSRAIQIKPSSADAYVKRAATYKSQGKFNRALKDYSEAIALDSGSYLFDPTLHFSNAYLGRGNLYYQMGELEKSVADYDSSLRLSPENSLAFLNKARALGDENRYDSAIASFTRAITLLSPREYNEAQEHAYFGRGLIYNITRQFDKALLDFNRAIQLKPKDPYAHFQRGNAEKALNKLDDAIADCTLALRFQKLTAKAYVRMAECYG